MRRIGLATVLSVGLNLFLFFWLINTYLYDNYFQAYVNLTISQIYPFIVLTLGVGGGSGLGYLLLKKKHSPQGIVGKIQKVKPFKAGTPIVSPPRSLAQSGNMPAGAPPAPSSKHTAYAVPPLPKSSTPSPSRTVPSTTWSTGAKSQALGSILTPRQEAPVKPAPSLTPTLRGEQAPKPSTAPAPSGFRPDLPQLSSIPRIQSESPPRPGTSWRPEPGAPGDKSLESMPTFPKPGMDLRPRKEGPNFGQPGSLQQGSQPTSPIPGSKWQPPEQKPGPGQWPENNQRSTPPMPSKWIPPGGAPGPQGQPQPSLGAPIRPGALPPRPPGPPLQGGPRPFVFQGPGRSGGPGPVGVPRPFRPEQGRPPPGMGPQPRPPQQGQGTTGPFVGPMPQPWTPPAQPTEKKDTGSVGSQDKNVVGSEPATKSGGEQRSPTDPGGSEMDWDTALDTILKTLRKDRVGDTK